MTCHLYTGLVDLVEQRERERCRGVREHPPLKLGVLHLERPYERRDQRAKLRLERRLGTTRVARRAAVERAPRRTVGRVPRRAAP